MEKVHKSKNKLLKLLPKAASTAVIWQNPPFSPGRDVKTRTNHKLHFSGPIIPTQSRLGGRTKMSKRMEAQEEPTSPKVSCIGQIKMKKSKSFVNPQSRRPKESREVNVSKIKKMFTGKKPPRWNEEERIESKASGSTAAAPPLGQMRRLASGRKALSSFNWTDQISPAEDNGRDCFSDEERGQRTAREASMIPFSAPILVGDGIGVKSRKEVNLWKRRTMNAPTQLQLQPK